MKEIQFPICRNRHIFSNEGGGTRTIFRFKGGPITKKDQEPLVWKNIKSGQISSQTDEPEKF